MMFGVSGFVVRSMYWLWTFLGFESREKKLARTEDNLLTSCKRFFEQKFIAVETGIDIRTVIFNPGVPNRPPLVLLHGLGSGLCSFRHNVRRLSRNCTVYAIDLPGFGRSSKPNISGNGEEIERKYVQWLESWRQRLGIEKFFLVGHDFGGYVATLYTLSHPWRVCHLILYDPWGFPILPFGLSDRSPSKNPSGNLQHFPSWILRLDTIFHFLRRMSFVYRFLWFYYLQVKLFAGIVRHPLQFLQSCCESKNPFDEYQVMCKQAQDKSGKIAYQQLSVFNMWAKDPLIKRINSLDNRVFITFIFGSKSWFDHRSAYEVKCSRSNEDSVSIYIIESDGRQAIHREKPREFESIILHHVQSYKEEHDEGWMEDDWIGYDHCEEDSGLYEHFDEQ